MRTHFLVLLYFWGNVNTAVPGLHLELPDDEIRQPNIWQIKQEGPKQNNHRSHLIKNALELLNKEKNNEKTIAINKCLYKNYELRNRLKCVKELISRSNSKTENYIPIYSKHSDEYDDSYEFQDLTKLGRTQKNDNFSQDYLDISDLLRANEKQNNTKKRYVLKVVQPNKYNRFDYDLTTFRRFNPNDETDILRSNSESSESSDSSEENDKLRTKNNVSNKRYDEDSDDSSSSEDTEKEGPKLSNPSVIYMQSPSHIYGADSRRRLPHFLPKRFHWTEDEMKDLTNYWFNGPQGKYRGLYRTPY